MFKVTFLQNDVNISKDDLNRIQDLKSYKEILVFNYKQGGKEAAEKLWHYTNNPEEFRLIEKLSSKLKWTSPNMCVGDVAWVVDTTTEVEQFWCRKTQGWKEIKNFTQTVKDIFLFVWEKNIG